MLLSTYIEKYRNGIPALTQAEAKVAGICGKLKSGWFKKNRYKIVDPVAMMAAREQRILKTAAKAARIKSGAVTRVVGPKALFSKYEPAHLPSMTVPASNSPQSEQYRFANNPAFLASYEWKQLRFQALQIHGRRCQCCGASPETGAVMNVDHVKSRRNFPELALDINNLQVLCGDCNFGKGNKTVDFRYA